MTQVVPWVPYFSTQQRVHHRTEGDALAVRPVLGRHRVLAGVGELTHERGGAAPSRPSHLFTPDKRCCSTSPAASSGRSSSSSACWRSRSWSSSSCRTAIRRSASPASSRRPQLLAEIHHRLGLDRPWYIEFGYFVKNFFTGDENGWPGLGYSYRATSRCSAEIIQRAPRTLLPDRRRGDDLADHRRRDRRPLGGQAAIAHRPARDGLRALRHLGAGLLARPDGALHLLAEARLDGRLRLRADRPGLRRLVLAPDPAVVACSRSSTRRSTPA